HPASLCRYYTFQSLFAFSMLGLVLSPSFIQMFVFWELVGLCSYLLIGYWYTRPTAARAAVKAFWITKLGDLGFVIGIVMLWSATGTFEFRALFAKAQEHALAIEGLGTIMFLVYLGAVGKSAQFPLHVWLPDAMEGPTPVSALIHAATMVAAGVYLLVRVAFLIQASQTALLVIAWIGTITALLGAVMATQQSDIKRILAYARNMSIFVICLTTACLTAFYVSRAVIAVFFGKPRGDAARTGKESPLVMIIPLLVLALFALIAGLESVAQNFLVVPHEKET